MSLFDNANAAAQARASEKARQDAAAQADRDLFASDPEAYLIKTKLSDEALRMELTSNGEVMRLLHPGETVTPRVEARLDELRAQGFEVETRPTHFAGDAPGSQRATTVWVRLPTA